jgi:Holliday junction resolvase RusA-like endonuclease
MAERSLPVSDAAASPPVIAEPPENELNFVLPFAPVSQQSSSGRRSDQKQAVAAHLAHYGFILTGDVHVDVTWLVPERVRYESDAAADVDNILKPLLDAMCGPAGVLVDDCQLVSIACGWLDGQNDQQELQVRARFSPDQWLRKDGLVFINFGRALCFPFCFSAPPQALRLILGHVERALETRATGEDLGLPAEIASLTMPAQRFFHRSKVTKFPVLSLEEARSRL